MSFSRILFGLVCVSLTTAVPAAFATNVGADLAAIEKKAPVYNLELPEAEIIRLVNEIEAQGLVGKDEISLDALRHRGDKAAYDKAVDVLSTRMQWAIYELSELKRNVVRYSVIVNQANLDKEKVELVTDTSSKISQNHYDRAMWSIAGAAQDEDAALKLCVSEVCVIEVADAFESMVHFAQSVNRDLNFKKLNSEKRVFWQFDRPILRASFSKAFRKMVPNNQSHNGYKVLAAGVFAPLSVVGITTIDLLRAAGSAIFNPRYSNIKLEVDEVRIGFKNVYKSQKAIFQSNYQEAANGSRATEYEKKEQAEKPASSNDNGGNGSNPSPADPTATQDMSYWYKLAKGASDAEKLACAKMGVISADKYDKLISELRAKNNNVMAQVAEIRTFAKSLTQKQYTDIHAYADSYAAFVRGKRDATSLQQIDAKMKGYLFEELGANFTASRERYWTGLCEASSSRYSSPSPNNASPSSWMTAQNGSCVYSGYSYYYAVETLAKVSFLSVEAGQVKYFACSRTNYQGRFTSCSSVDLVTGAEAGLTFEEASRAPLTEAGAHGQSWMGQTKDQFVASEIPACF